MAICLQPARGYNIDPASSYHDPDLPPPHGYLAFYAWLREGFRAHAVVHLGKHGNLEWLPGKALALSAGCFPEAALGPLPHLYPFIVNDPGEGAQAKRRAQAVIIDHLTPPLTRAESYGPLRELERLVDEYAEAAGVDPRRLRVLSEEIVSLMRITGIDVDCGIGVDEDAADALTKLDRYLCELKEMQIRDGLHVFGSSPDGAQLRDLLLAIARTPRGAGERDASLIRALADDLELGFDPLAADLARSLDRPTPAVLDGAAMSGEPSGDTLERLEGTGGDAGRGRASVRTGVDAHARRPRRDRAASAPGGGALRRERDARAAERPRRPLRRTGTVGRADARPAGRAADRAQLLFRRHANRTDTGRVDAGLEVGEPARPASRAGARRMAEAPRRHRLGDEQHAYRRRRHRPGAGADGRPADLGRCLRPGSRLRDPAVLGARPAAGRCDLADLRVFPRRLPQPHRPVRTRRRAP